MVKVDIISMRKELPEYQTPGSSGVDIRAWIHNPITIDPGEIRLVPTGMKIQVPSGYEIQIRPRSGLALRNGITVLNSPATIDSDYTDEIKVVLINHGELGYTILPGERIAQMVLASVPRFEFNRVDTLVPTDRKGGFGSTGK